MGWNAVTQAKRDIVTHAHMVWDTVTHAKGVGMMLHMPKGWEFCYTCLKGGNDVTHA